MKMVVRPCHHVAQVIEDLVFGLRVDAGESVVEDQNARVADQGAGNGGALFLSAGKRDAALADHGVVASGKPSMSTAMLRGLGGAAASSESVAESTPSAMFSRMRSLKRNVSCGTKPMFRRNEDNEYSRMGRPSISTVPGSAS